jgi:beta-lactamase superfamily II metal-dependent hydrolase
LDNIKKTIIRPLKAGHGDCIIVNTFDADGNPFNMLIDGGTAGTFKEVLASEIRNLAFIDIVILTHIDSDHIGGLIKYIKSAYYDPKKVGRFWFNSKNIRFINSGENISFKQAISLEEALILKKELKTKWAEDIVVGGLLDIPPGIEIEIVSPTKQILDNLYRSYPDLSAEFQKKLQDILIAKNPVSQISKGALPDLASEEFKPQKSVEADIVNSSSIAFILRTFDCKVLFLADSNPKVVLEALEAKEYSKENKLQVDLVKVSHHGSINNTSCDLLDIIDCDRYFISTNGGSGTDQHPDRETIARILYHPERKKNLCCAKERTILFNYPLNKVEERAGKFINQNDLEQGNWKIMDNVNQWSKNE